MWTTVALLGALTLAPAQAAGPKCENPRFTHGLLGQTRKDDKFLPGDTVWLVFDVAGMKVKDTGLVQYSMGFNLTKKGKKGEESVQKREPQDLEAVNSLGTGNFPSYVYWNVPRDAESPGDYTMKVTVTDRQTKKSATLTKTFTVLPTELGFVQTAFTTYRNDPTPPYGFVGQSMVLHYSLVGFGRDKQDKKTNVTLTIRILDSDGKPTFEKPLTNDIKSDEKAAPGMMVFTPYVIQLNRAGKFKVEITAKDNVTGKQKTEKYDLTVTEPK